MEPNASSRGVSHVSPIDPLLTNVAPTGRSTPRPFQIRPLPEDGVGFTDPTDRDSTVIDIALSSAARPDTTRDAPAMAMTPDFHSFYVAARPQVGRALVVTLRDPDLAADAVDEAMVRAFQRWDQVSALDNPSGWVYRVGLNYARSRLKRLLRRSPPGNESTEFTIADPAIDAAIAQLSVDHRAVVVCRHFLGWSESETAVALGIRPGTVKSRLSRALTQLESTLHHLRPEGPR
jgi:RNA polymerase sigma factor (sigma-70 family)